MDGSSFRGAVLRDAHLPRLSCEKCDFGSVLISRERDSYTHSTSLSGASLEGARLDKSSFENADLSGTNLTAVSCRYCNLRGVELGQDEPLQVKGADLYGASFDSPDVARRFRDAGAKVVIQ